ncbi:MAG: hypothetical protein HY775_01065 [Acidobacteria bacterium]|nr:hypothetical protein [Acidobacteriota bacterium]
MSSSTVYQASDLSQRRRAVLNEARAGYARIRDTDGTSLLMMPEEAARLNEEVTRWARALVPLLRARSRKSLAEAIANSELSWLKLLPPDDVEEFLEEVASALQFAIDARDISGLVRAIEDWRTTALALRDSTNREILLGRPSRMDFAEVARPSE